MTVKSLTLSASLLILAAACSPGQSPAPPPKPVPTPSPAKAPAAALNPAAVDSAVYDAQADASAERTPAVLRAQVLLDRARFSSGVIDGRMGENVRQAVAAFQQARNLPVTGTLDAAVYAALLQADAAPVLSSYVIAAEDVAGPFAPTPSDLADQAALPALGYQTAREGLAEKFHMTEDLLQALNPAADFSAAGQTITVAAAATGELAKGAVASIKIDKAERAVLAYDAAGALVGFYPASIGSGDMPAPSGEWTVKGVAPKPTYTYDPSRLSYKAKGGATGKMVVQPGPNNPVGAVYIALSKDTYGIHGTPEPQEIGKTFSHGCVRLTNWDARTLASGVKPGVKVAFVEGTPAAAAVSAAAAKS